jgi:hypothetical protein
MSSPSGASGFWGDLHVATASSPPTQYSRGCEAQTSPGRRLSQLLIRLTRSEWGFLRHWYLLLKDLQEFTIMKGMDSVAVEIYDPERIKLPYHFPVERIHPIVSIKTRSRSLDQSVSSAAGVQ